MHAEGALRRELDHARSERREQPLVAGTGVGAASSPSRKVSIALTGCAQSLVDSGCPIPAPSEETAGEVGDEPGVVARDLRRIVLPDVEDAGDHRDALGRLEEWARIIHRWAGTEPECAVAERFDPSGE